MIPILYVDDEEDLLSLCRLYLERDGQFQVDTAVSAAEAMRRLKTCTYEAIVSDYQMSGMDGISFLKEVRATGNDLPFILFTGRGREEVVIEAINNGADFYLQKGGDVKAQFAELIHKIRQAVGKHTAEKTLRLNEERLRFVTAQIPGTVWAVDRDLRFTFSRGAGLAALGLRPDEAVGMTLYDFFGTQDPSFLPIDRHRKVLSGVSVSYEYVQDEIVYQTFLSPQYDEHGMIVGVIGIATDITLLKRSESVVKDREAKFAAAFAANPDPFAITDIRTGRIIEVNPAFLEWSGYSQAEIQGRTTKDLNIWADPTERDRIIQHILAHDVMRQSPVTLRTRTGEVRDCLFSARSITLEGKEYLFSHVHDISLAKALELDCNRAESEKIAVLSGLRDIIVEYVDPEMRIIWANEAMKEAFGISGEISGDTCYRITQHRTSPCPGCTAKKAIETGTFQEGEVMTPDGRNWLVRSNPVFEEGVIQGVVHVAIDISAMKKAHKDLQDQKSLLQQIIDHTETHLVYLDRDFRFIMVNETYAKTCNRSPEDLIGKNHFDVYPDRENEEIFCRVRDTGIPVYVHDKPFVFPDQPEKGTTYWDWTLFPVSSQEGQVKGLVFSLVETTERKRVENALLRANRQYQLLSGITSHDIANKVTAVLGHLEETGEDLSENTIQECFLQVRSAMEAILAQIAFARLYEDIGTHEPGWQDLGALISGLSCPESMTCVSDVQGIEVFANPLLSKVFENLLDNSQRHGGNVTSVHVMASSSDTGLRVLWEDDGNGVPVFLKEQIFERGYGSNSGLGLFLVREILSLTDITIRETSETGKGARFEIEVPAGAFRHRQA